MRRAVLAAYRLRGPVLYAAAALLIAVALSGDLALGEEVRRARGAVAILAAGALALCIALALAGPRLLPARTTAVVASPVRGRWLGINSPASKVPSHGVRAYGQAYAIDLAFEPADGIRPPFGVGPAMRAPEHYPAFGQPVLAMIDGTVVRAVDRHRDHRARSSWSAFVYMMLEGAIREIGGPGFILGNHVTIRGGDGTYATVAHLRRGSVAVRTGEAVRAGQRIGRCGNSGNSSEPHVHAQLMDRESPWTAQGLPMAFSAVALGGGPVDALPRTGQHMTAPEAGADRAAALELAAARPCDVPQIVALVRAAYAPYVGRIGREPAPMTADYATAVADGRAVVARAGGRIAGLLVTDPRPDHLLIENVAVAPEAQGLGIGTALLARADDEARALGLPETRLYTNARMTENLAYYPRRGFREVGRRVEDGFDRVYFARPV